MFIFYSYPFLLIFFHLPILVVVRSGVCALQADVKLAGISMAVIQVAFPSDSYPEVEFLDNNLTKVFCSLLEQYLSFATSTTVLKINTKKSETSTKNDFQEFHLWVFVESDIYFRFVFTACVVLEKFKLVRQFREKCCLYFEIFVKRRSLELIYILRDTFVCDLFDFGIIHNPYVGDFLPRTTDIAGLLLANTQDFPEVSHYLRSSYLLVSTSGY
jgi:hypothetical protein